MYMLVSYSTRYHRRNAAVISVDRIIRGCHSMGKSGLHINHEWTMDNILDEASHFHINSYIDVDTFTLFKC